jgi:hypothetical protein
VTEVIVMSWTGRSCGPVLAVAIVSTTLRLWSSATSPKIVCLRLRCGVAPTVMKNCEPFVPGPAFAIASRYGRLNASSGWNSSPNW